MSYWPYYLRWEYIPLYSYTVTYTVFHLVKSHIVQFCQIVEIIDFSQKDFWKYDHCIRIVAEWNRWRPFLPTFRFPQYLGSESDNRYIFTDRRFYRYLNLKIFLVSITREESILAKMFGLQYMLGASMPPSGVYITGTYVVGIYALLYCAVSTISEDEKRAQRE